MNDFFEYSVKSGIALSVFYLFYWLVLRNNTNFRINRLVLMFSLTASMILPAIAAVFRFEPIPGMILDISFSTPEAKAQPSSIINEINPVFTWSLIKVLSVVYTAGAIIVLARLAYQAVYLYAVGKLSKVTECEGFKLISLDTDMIPFSYFNRIFIPKGRIEKESIESVIRHERSHLSQGHYIDLFLIQIISVLQWFNPFIWLFEKSVKEIHEYLADEAVLESGTNIGNYQAILVNQALGGPVFLLTNQFNQSLIKKRIIMMKSVKSSGIRQLKALLLLPLAAALMFAFANPDVIIQKNSEIKIKGSVTDRSSGKPLAGCVVGIKGTTTGTVTDADGNYEIIVSSENDKLVVSFIGFQTEEAPVNKNTTINFQLEKDVLAVDFNSGNKLTPVIKTEQKDGDKSGGQYTFVEELPSYPGGTDALHNFLLSNLKYPESAKDKGIEGTVQMSFIIDEAGAITRVKILRGVSPDIDKEAIRLTNLMKGWKPAMQNGKPLSTVATMPIEFKLK